MPAYFIVDVDVHNPAGMREYLERVPGTLTKYGGRYILRGGPFEGMEGDWQPARGGVLGFPKIGQAKRWDGVQENGEKKGAILKTAKNHKEVVGGAPRVLLDPL